VRTPLGQSLRGIEGKKNRPLEGKIVLQSKGEERETSEIAENLTHQRGVSPH